LPACWVNLLVGDGSVVQDGKEVSARI
jgi:hypothetical protein